MRKSTLVLYAAVPLLAAGAERAYADDYSETIRHSEFPVLHYRSGSPSVREFTEYQAPVGKRQHVLPSIYLPEFSDYHLPFHGEHRELPLILHEQAAPAHIESFTAALKGNATLQSSPSPVSVVLQALPWERVAGIAVAYLVTRRKRRWDADNNAYREMAALTE